MKTLLKAIAVMAFASSAVSVANAQSAFPDPANNAAGGALIVSIWDNVANASLVYAIPNAFYQDINNGSFNSFSGAIPQFNSVFGASDPSNIQYSVFAGGFFSPEFPSQTPAAAFVTGPVGGAPSGLINSNVAGLESILSTPFYNALRNACGADGVCISTDPQAGNFAGRNTWADLTAQLPFSAATGVGNALGFYDLAQAGQDFGGGFIVYNGGDAAIVEDTLGQWLLDASGNLSYSVVPLPAAAWLLLSGLFGFGAIARRRAA